MSFVFNLLQESHFTPPPPPLFKLSTQWTQNGVAHLLREKSLAQAFVVPQEHPSEWCTSVLAFEFPRGNIEQTIP